MGKVATDIYTFEIREKEYTDRFCLSGKPITFIVMAFSSKKRTVSDVKIVR